MNIVILSGHLGADPELRQSKAGESVCNFRLATKRGKDATDWHKVVCFRTLAETCAQHLDKGSQVNLRGRIEYGSYDKDGVTVYTTTIIADMVDFIRGKARHQGGQQASEEVAEEIPF